jgi:peptidoglycan/LPS O-acetylase OafA/YrhL
MFKENTDPVRPSSYLPTLDGWRTLAIAGVILCHDKVHRLGPLNTEWLNRHGNLGVDVFFAISGLLICSRLMAEERASGAIDVRSFYIRRCFRILPPAIFFLAALELLAHVVGLPVALPEILASIFFVRNYTFTFLHFQNIYPFYTSHFWSLAVEEHFYLVLPALLVLTPKKWRIPSLLGLASIVAVHRFISGSLATEMHTDMRLDALFVPAAIAVFLSTNGIPIWLERWLRFWPLLAVALYVLVTIELTPRFELLALAWLLPFFVLGTTLRPKSFFSRFLELPGMRYFGRLSYSIYLWQQLFFVGHFGSVTPGLGLVQRWPYCLAATIACAMVSYYFIERPLIRVGHRLASNQSLTRQKQTIAN